MYRLSHTSLPHAWLTRGFTLQELLVSLAISGSLATGGVEMWTVIQENAMTAAANEIVTHLALARSEAIKRRAPVKMCASKDRASCAKADADYTFWQHGWLVYADGNRNGKPEAGEVLRTQPALSGNFVIRTSKARRTITYQPIGTSGGSTITFAVCGSRDTGAVRYVTVSNSGRVRVSRNTRSTVRCT